MPFNTGIYFMVIVAFATYTSACDVNYCGCMSDPETYRKKYETVFDNYYINGGADFNKSMKQLKLRLLVLKENNPCGLSTDPELYVDDLFTLCGGNRLSASYAPIWRTDAPKKSDDVYCQFIVRHCTAIEEQNRHIQSLFDNCNYLERFDKSTKTIIDGCGKCKK